MVLQEGLGIAVALQILAERHQRLLAGVRMARRIAIEAGQVGQHSPEAGTEQVGQPSDDGGGADPAIFRPSGIQGHGKGHVGLLGGDLQLVEQGDEIGIVQGVVDDEARVHGRQAGEGDGVGMAPQAAVLLIQRDPGIAGHQPRRRQAGHSGSHDSNGGKVRRALRHEQIRIDRTAGVVASATLRRFAQMRAVVKHPSTCIYCLGCPVAAGELA